MIEGIKEIGKIYENLEEYKKALEIYEKNKD